MTTNDPRPRDHSLTIRKPYFDLIASGAKTTEVRVGYPKIRRIAAGDTLTIIYADESVTTRITAVNEYESFAAMLDTEDPSAIGGPDMTHDQLVAAIRAIYPPEKEALGVFALHLALVLKRG
ncbi:ASCH domain-containing protein [Streptomyces yaizuensis]|uniref:ASCH domain-containing protein n=1 Tax=Streptomyces yaizuensis TaxID=2989713 RepID=A0ABQ5P542_9ACTN|nr:ASCH domain-containing protein [Streptomyces sp. YSPA8]GLF97712.1 ASCH domain-containing protein [Streptomyces sp. YSPA8]